MSIIMVVKNMRSFPPLLSFQSQPIRNPNSSCKFLRKSATFTTLNLSRNRNVRPTWCNGIPNRFANYDYYSEERWEAPTSYEDGGDTEVSNGACAVCESPEYQSDFPRLWETNRFRIEHTANRVEIPVSLRMIKKKKQLQTKMGGSSMVQCSVKKAFVSMVYIMGELQNSAMQLKEKIRCEDFKEVMSKVHGEMNDSFVWLFGHILSQTPTLMVYMILLLANFSLYSMSAAPPVVVKTVDTLHDKTDESKDVHHPSNELTDMLYQLRISEDPTNPLLLTNYARFLYLIQRDYDRAEDLFRRALQIEPVEAESLCQYADFLWTVRNDLWGAEERYQQAIAEDTQNPHYAFKYANFLWNSGGEETCFPLEQEN